jgi:tetratricopeptide (TPR) repeat protein
MKTGDDQPNFGNAIWWYSCDKASIYYQINSIVRLENFELLMSYRYYLSDLCRMIEFMYQKRKTEKGDIAHTLYRADNINENQLKMMSKPQKGQFISLLGFISTTSDLNIAKGYAEKQKVYEGNKRVLFVINVKPHLPCTAFAYIDHISFHPEEKEVLFSMGSSFIVDTISEPINGENYYTINLTASEIDKSLVEDIRIKVENCSPSGRAVLLARYLVELGEYRAARKYLTSLLTQAGDGGVLVNDISLASVYSCLGITYARQGLHSDALKAFKQALNTQARLEYSNNNAFAEIHNNIGLAYVGLGHMDEAEATFAEAARMQLREFKSNQQYLASIYGNIGYVHYKQKTFDEAEKYFRKAEKIYKQNTSRIAHDALELSLMKAEFLTNYGHLLSAHKHSTDNRKPQDLYNEALKLYKGILFDDDPKLMQTYINIMLAFIQSKFYNEATKYFGDSTVQRLIDKQEANMFELNSSITQRSLGSLYELIGACYASQNNFDKAIEVWKDAYVFERKARLEQLLLVTTDGNSSILTAEHNRFIHEWYRKGIDHYHRLSR